MSTGKHTSKPLAHNLFNFLEFCIPVKDRHSLVPVSFTKENYLWTSYKGFGTYHTASKTGQLFPDFSDVTDGEDG
jgi:hypothetical protein